MGHTFSHPTCKHCGAQRRHQATGRPGEYCSTKCRQAAHRQRQAAADPPDTEEFDQALCMQLTQIARAAHSILDALDQPETPVSEPLEQMVRLQVLAEHLTPLMVARTKQRGASWERIGAVLGIGKDTARKKWSLPTRRTSRPAPTAPPSPRPASRPGTIPSRDSDSAGDGRSPTAPPPSTAAAYFSPLAGQDLATVLSSLQRASGLSLRTLANRTGLSASYLSRLMNGERFPAWKNVAVLARACGADPEVLRRVWKASSARRESQPRPTSLASALRFLHQRAGSPTPWAIAVTSGNELDQDHITALLNGTATGDWEDVHRLIQLLDGEPAYFLPLWEAEAAAQPAAPPDTAAGTPPSKAPVSEGPPPASTRVEELLAAFKDALGSARIPPSSPARRCLAAPIPGATHWSGR
ncbi:helix-turn-helix domain-containing protein [Streptomyces afghaniensis]|uniref:helix-turn-helix domain-containing protein n=1 Tax=Streptomyces afghaniensis TaxID=66865 RepID=UPI002787B1CD|nr:helix-turn-helix transcriptional regulator [Streptomyces afghaniensis]MDQ1013522.1 transcriptional regulator with XRE-family HTH domain [Streptomyces afghaniensis]